MIGDYWLLPFQGFLLSRPVWLCEEAYRCSDGLHVRVQFFVIWRVIFLPGENEMLFLYISSIEQSLCLVFCPSFASEEKVP